MIDEIRCNIIPNIDNIEEKTLSTMLYDVANRGGIEAKELFKCLYQILIAKVQGPRLAGFMKIIGKEKLSSLFNEVMER